MIFDWLAVIAAVSGACVAVTQSFARLQRGSIVARDRLALTGTADAKIAADRRRRRPGSAARRRCRPASHVRGATDARSCYARQYRRSASWLCAARCSGILLTDSSGVSFSIRWGSAGGCQHLLPSVVSWVTRIADGVFDAVGSDHLAAGRAVDRALSRVDLVPECTYTGWVVVHCTGYVPWPGGVSGSLTGAGDCRGGS